MIKRLFWNEEERRTRSLCRIASLILVIVAVLMAISLASEAFALSHLVQTLVFLIVSLSSVWLAGRFLDHRSFQDFGFEMDRNWWSDFSFGIALGLVLMAAIFATEYALGWVTVTDTLHTASGSFGWALTAALLSYIAVGIYEELLFRGYMLRNMAEGFNFKAFGPVKAILLAAFVSSFIFGLAHLANDNSTWISTVTITVAGIFIALGYVLTKQLAIPIGLHISWNFAQGNLFGFAVSGDVQATSLVAIDQGGPDLWTGGAFGPEAGLLGLAAMIAGSVILWAWIRYRYGRAELQLVIAEAPGISEPDIPTDVQEDDS